MIGTTSRVVTPPARTALANKCIVDLLVSHATKNLGAARSPPGALYSMISGLASGGFLTLLGSG